MKKIKKVFESLILKPILDEEEKFCKFDFFKGALKSFLMAWDGSFCHDCYFSFAVKSSYEPNFELVVHKPVAQ